jgi:hypothetical protein
MDRKQPMIQFGVQHLQPLRENKGLLELPIGNATMKKRAIGNFVLPSADHEQIVLNRDVEVFTRKSGHGERDFEPVIPYMLDIVGGVTICLGRPF